MLPTIGGNCLVNFIAFVAFAFNAKSFALRNCHSIFFSFSPFRPFFRTDCQKQTFLANVSRLVIKKACDQDLNNSLDTPKNSCYS